MTTGYGATDPVGAAGAPGAFPAGGPAGSPAGAAGDADDRPSIGALLGEITQDLSTLFRQEVELAKVELTDQAKKAGTGAGMFGGAAVAANLALVFVSVSLWWALGALINRGWSALVVALLWGVVALVLVKRGQKQVKEVGGAPRTAETLKKIPNAARGHEEKNR
jgi:uncharacterized membrane protein YqjE